MGVMRVTPGSENELQDVVWQSYSAELIRFAGVLVGPHDAQDVVVDAVVRCSLHLDGVYETQRRAYLYRAVSNEARNLYRSRRRRWARDLAAVGPSSTGGPDSQVDVRRAVASLSLGQRAAIFCVYWADMTERETAELLGVSLGTVRQHLVRARTHLRRALHD
jgi:RNA polymerase sigma factor (sigma-70 family)